MLTYVLPVFLVDRVRPARLRRRQSLDKVAARWGQGIGRKSHMLELEELAGSLVLRF